MRIRSFPLPTSNEYEDPRRCYIDMDKVAAVVPVYGNVCCIHLDNQTVIVVAVSAYNVMHTWKHDE